MPRFLSREDTMKAFELAQGNYRPRQITEARWKYESGIRAAAASAVSKRRINPARVRELLALRFYIDELYLEWIMGRI